MASLLLVEDHTLFRAGIRVLLEQGRHQIVGEATDGHAAVRLARELSPEVALLDITIPLLNGIETARIITRESPKTRVVMLSMHADAAYVAAAFDAGAMGYVPKDAALEELEAAIRGALAGEKYLSPSLMGGAPPGSAPMDGPASPLLQRLSSRERQILQLIAEAFSSPEISRQLGLKVRTVETYRQRMMDKLNLHSVAALTAFAIGHGISSYKPAQ